MSASVKWWIRNCIVCQAAKTSRRASRLPLISLPLPSSPREMVSFDILGALPKTKNGKKYILLIVDLLHKNIFRTSAVSSTNVVVTKNPTPYQQKKRQLKVVLVTFVAKECVTRWGCPKLLLFDRGAEFAAQVAKQVYEILGSTYQLFPCTHKRLRREVGSYTMPNVITCRKLETE